MSNLKVTLAKLFLICSELVEIVEGFMDMISQFYVSMCICIKQYVCNWSQVVRVSEQMCVCICVCVIVCHVTCLAGFQTQFEQPPIWTTLVRKRHRQRKRKRERERERGELDCMYLINHSALKSDYMGRRVLIHLSAPKFQICLDPTTFS